MRTNLLAIAFLAPGISSFAQAPADAPYMNPNLPPEQRAADLVSRMTLEEKVLQMQNSAPAIPRLGVGVYNYMRRALTFASLLATLSGICLAQTGPRSEERGCRRSAEPSSKV